MTSESTTTPMAFDWQEGDGIGMAIESRDHSMVSQSSGEFVEDPTRMYLTEIGRVMLLRAAEERQLALEFRRADACLKDVESEIDGQSRDAYRATDTVGLLLKRIENQSWLLQAIVDYLDIQGPPARSAKRWERQFAPLSVKMRSTWIP